MAPDSTDHAPGPHCPCLQEVERLTDELRKERRSWQEFQLLTADQAVEIERLKAAIDRAHPHAEPKPGCALCEWNDAQTA